MVEIDFIYSCLGHSWIQHETILIYNTINLKLIEHKRNNYFYTHLVFNTHNYKK